jgi:signal transduction histidine kinase
VSADAALFRSREARAARAAILFLAACAALWLASGYSYLLFHSVVEVTSIAIAAAVFMISWSSRGYRETQPFVLLGIGYLFVAILDLLHTFSYKGMGVFPPDQDLATKLWVAARGIQALVTLAFVLLAGARRPAPNFASFLLVGGASAAAVLSIFVWKVFPLCLVEGQGVTLFKKLAEYVISGVLAASVVLLIAGKSQMDRAERGMLAAAFGLNAVSELVFTLYVSAYGTQNLIGHLLKLGSFLLAYQALFSAKIRSRMTLIEELRLSTARLEKSEAELRLANLAKDKFFSIVAHDLRNPISGILLISDRLTAKFEHLERERIRELCTLVHEGAAESARLLESILAWASTQSGKVKVQPSLFSVAELAEGIVSLQRTAAEGKGVAVSSCVAPGESVWADEDMTATVLRNFLSNAVKFTAPGGAVTVGAAARDGRVHITVRDTGRGMSSQEVESLFRIDVHYSCAGTDGERGAGIGLILCHELARMNGGTIEVESTPGAGSTFTLALPAAAP